MTATTDTEAERADEAERPVFYFDDCCPLCRGYTAVFAGLGLAGRQGFSTIGDDALEDLDFDRARHQIPLRAPDSGAVAYGLDGILDLVSGRWRVLGPVVRFRPVRRALDGFYWFVTYNRRHIVTAAPPLDGVDCAPDFHRPAVLAYLAFCAVVAGGLSAVAGVGPVVAVAALAALALVALRDGRWGIGWLPALGHVGSVAAAASLVGSAVAGLAAAFSFSGPDAAVVALAASAVTGARKIWLRRWMIERSAVPGVSSGRSSAAAAG